MLLEGAESRFELPGGTCPRWIHPNADAAGYYRFRIDGSLTRNLVKAREQLNDAEMLALADSFSAALADGSGRADDFLDRAPLFADASFANVVTMPLGDLVFLKQRVADARGRKRIDALLRKHWGKRLRRLGLDPVAGEPEEARVIRDRLIGVLLSDGRPPWLLEQMAERGRAVLGADGTAFNAGAVSADQLRPALYAAVLADGVKALARVQAHLRTVDDSIHRAALIGALSAAESTEAFEAALAFALDPAFRSSELIRVVGSLMSHPQHHAALWTWLQANDGVLMQRVPAVFQGKLSSFAAELHCSEAGARQIEVFYGDRVANLESGPRTLAQALESVRLCAARQAQWARTW
jgi:alanyl aminopeptidase